MQINEVTKTKIANEKDPSSKIEVLASFLNQLPSSMTLSLDFVLGSVGLIIVLISLFFLKVRELWFYKAVLFSSFAWITLIGPLLGIFVLFYLGFIREQLSKNTKNS